MKGQHSHIREDIGAFLAYEPDTGALLWRVTRSSRAIAGDVAGSRDELGYCRIVLDRKTYRSNRVAYFLMTGEQPAIVDHVDGDPFNDRWANLRNADPSQSSANRKRRVGQRYPKGVAAIRRSKRFEARITMRGKRVGLGTFDTPDEAHEAYCRAAAELHGAFARPA